VLGGVEDGARHGVRERSAGIAGDEQGRRSPLLGQVDWFVAERAPVGVRRPVALACVAADWAAVAAVGARRTVGARAWAIALAVWHVKQQYALPFTRTCASNWQSCVMLMPFWLRIARHSAPW
jgi:hypothetical protein